MLLAITMIASLSCHKGSDPKPTPNPDVIRLKDVNIAHLPSPYYHFEYDAAGLITAASFSDSMGFYDVLYSVNKNISQMRNKYPANKDVLDYTYDNGDVSIITITDRNGVKYRRAFLDYTPTHQLKSIEWELKADAGFSPETTLELSYLPDGNLRDIVTHYFALGNQTAATFTTTYSDYDDKKNVDAFSLLHPDQFHHLFLLPGVKIQLNNPRKEVRTGDGVHYQVDYTYTYDAANRPVIQNGDFQWTSGSDNGKHTQLHSDYSYYD